MPRRKSLLAQMYTEHQKAKRERQRAEERAQRAWDADARKTASQMEREAAQERRDAERTVQAQQRAAEQAERARQQAVAKAEREAATQARAEQREQAAALRDQQRKAAEDRRLAAQQRLAEAEFRTDAARRGVAVLERLLSDRNRDLATWNRRAEDVFNMHGPQAFVEVLQQALAASVYPDRLHGSCAATYHPEARELWVEYELPRQDVIPPVAGYRYLKTKDLVAIHQGRSSGPLCPDGADVAGRGGDGSPLGDTPGRVVDWRAGIVIIASCARRAWPALG